MGPFLTCLLLTFVFFYPNELVNTKQTMFIKLLIHFVLISLVNFNYVFTLGYKVGRVVFKLSLGIFCPQLLLEIFSSIVHAIFIYLMYELIWGIYLLAFILFLTCSIIPFIYHLLRHKPLNDERNLKLLDHEFRFFLSASIWICLVNSTLISVNWQCSSVYVASLHLLFQLKAYRSYHR